MHLEHGFIVSHLFLALLHGLQAQAVVLRVGIVDLNVASPKKLLLGGGSNHFTKPLMVVTFQ